MECALLQCCVRFVLQVVPRGPPGAAGVDEGWLCTPPTCDADNCGGCWDETACGAASCSWNSGTSLCEAPVDLCADVVCTSWEASSDGDQAVSAGAEVCAASPGACLPPAPPCWPLTPPFFPLLASFSSVPASPPPRHLPLPLRIKSIVLKV